MGEALKRGVDQSLLYLDVLEEMQDIVVALFGIASKVENPFTCWLAPTISNKWQLK
jgi:hypothetical protein